MKTSRSAILGLSFALIMSILTIGPARASSSNGCSISGIDEGMELSTAVQVTVACDYAWSSSDIILGGVGVGVWHLTTDDFNFLVFPTIEGAASLSVSDDMGDSADVTFTNTDAGDLSLSTNRNSLKVTPVSRPFNVTSQLDFEGRYSVQPVSEVRIKMEYPTVCYDGCTETLNGDGEFSVTIDPINLEQSSRLCIGSNESVNYFDAAGQRSESEGFQQCIQLTLVRSGSMALTVWRKGNVVLYRAMGRDKKQSSLRMKNAAPLSCAFQVERKVGTKWKKVKASGWPKWSSLNENVDYLAGSIVSAKKIQLRTRYTGCKFTERTKHTKFSHYKKRKEWVCVYWGALCYWYRWKQPIYKTYYTKKHFKLSAKSGSIKKI